MEMKTEIASPLPKEAWHDVRQLAIYTAESAGGRFRPIDGGSEVFQGPIPISTPGGNFEGHVVDGIAASVEKEYPALVERMKSDSNQIIIDKLAADLNDGRNVLLNMNHGSLLRSGIGLRLVCKSLEDQGVEFEKAAIGGIALLGLEVELNNDSAEDESPYIPASYAAGMVTDHFFVSIPGTKRGKILRERYPEETAEHNELMTQALSEQLQGDKGVLLMMLGSGTHDRAKDDPSTLVIDTVSQGTIDLIKDNRLRVVHSAVLDLPKQPMDFELVSGPNVLRTPGQMHRDMSRVARVLGNKAASFGFDYEYDHPVVALQQAA